MKYRINQNQCGFLMKNGSFVKTIYHGDHRYQKLFGYQVIVEEMEGLVGFAKVPAEVLMQDAGFREHVLDIRIPEGFVGVLRENGVVKKVLTEPKYLYWNGWNRYTVELLDMREPEMSQTISRSLLEQLPLKYYKKIEVQPGEVGILYYNCQVERELPPGTYYYWTWSVDITCRIVDLKVRKLEISGQEILTADRIGIRLNLICSYRIADPRRMVETIRNLEEQLYSCVQLMIREYVGRYRLDELLAQKDEISGYICERLRKEEQQYCVEFQNAGIKDIILPGEIRDIMNTVLVAERRAQANVITRREEVASTRSLLNTAKLMDENKTLYKLKEMECLERICTQVGSINVNGGGVLLEQLKGLLGGE